MATSRRLAHAALAALARSKAAVARGWGLPLLVDPRVSDFPAQPDAPVARILQEEPARSLWRALVIRGLGHSNQLLKGAVGRWCAELTDRVRRECDPVEPSDVPTWTYREDDAATLRDLVARRRCPVIIKGFPYEARDWTVEGLASRFAEYPVLFTNDEGVTFEAPLRRLLDPPAGGWEYVHNCGRLFFEHPELLEELNLPRAGDVTGWGNRQLTAQLFIGATPGTGTPFHCAGSDNVFFQIEGRKRWAFVDPSYSLLIYPLLSVTNAYQGSCLPHPFEEELFETYPLFAYCPRFEASLGVGDVLINPRWWYHSVSNLTRRSTGVATRWNEMGNPTEDTNHVYSALRDLSPRLTFDVMRASMRGAMEDRRYAHLMFEEHAHDEANEDRLDIGRAAWGLPEPVAQTSR